MQNPSVVNTEQRQVTAPYGRDAQLDVVENTENSLANLLSGLPITEQNFAQSVLYTWTTEEQLTALRRDRVLLVASALTHGPPTPFNQLLIDLAARGSNEGNAQSIAALLLTNTALQRRRYTWPWPLATSVGFSRRGYGEVLVRIVLKPEALIGWLQPSHHTGFIVTDLHGTVVPSELVVRDPSRLAAIYHVRNERGLEYAFREYVVCNESMVFQWEVGTSAITLELLREQRLIETLMDYVRNGGSRDYLRTSHGSPVSPLSWVSIAENASIADRYAGILAADLTRYSLEVNALQTMLGVIQTTLQREREALVQRSP